MCIKEYSSDLVFFDCEDSDSKMLTTMQLSHPGLTVGQVNNLKLSITGSQIFTSGYLISYSEPQSQIVSLPIELSINDVQAPLCFLCGLNSLSLFSLCSPFILCLYSLSIRFRSNSYMTRLESLQSDGVHSSAAALLASTMYLSCASCSIYRGH